MSTLDYDLLGSKSASQKSDLHQTTLRNLLLAGVLTIGLYFIPYAGFITYPLRLLVTFIHEGSHAMAALLTGGLPTDLSIQPDASGLTLTRGGFGPIISSAGYLGATLYGAMLIAALRRGVPGRSLLMVTGVWIGLLTLFLVKIWHPFSFVSGALIATGLVIAGVKLSPKIAAWFAGFVGVQCILNALFDLRTLFDLSVATNVATDAQNMARMTWIPAVVWSVLWIGIAFAMLFFVLAPAFGVKVKLRK